jgi:hypothetical protein
MATPENAALTRTESPSRAAISPRSIARRTPATLTMLWRTPMRRRNRAVGIAQKFVMALRLMVCPVTGSGQSCPRPTPSLSAERLQLSRGALISLRRRLQLLLASDGLNRRREAASALQVLGPTHVSMRFRPCHPAVWGVVPLSLQKDTEQQQRLVVLLRAVVCDLVHDELTKLLEWPCRVLNQQLLEACEAKLFIVGIGYFRDPIGQH